VRLRGEGGPTTRHGKKVAASRYPEERRVEVGPKRRREKKEYPDKLHAEVGPKRRHGKDVMAARCLEKLRVCQASPKKKHVKKRTYS
jgi:hypothetical protein